VRKGAGKSQIRRARGEYIAKDHDPTQEGIPATEARQHGPDRRRHGRHHLTNGNQHGVPLPPGQREAAARRPVLGAGVGPAWPDRDAISSSSRFVFVYDPRCVMSIRCQGHKSWSFCCPLYKHDPQPARLHSEANQVPLPPTKPYAWRSPSTSNQPPLSDRKRAAQRRN
jgi:hypothetical protein